MHRPGPLMPLPLDQFLLPPPRTSKRPHSPAGPSPFSPAKRRILNEEGLFSLDRSCKTPLPRDDATSRFSKALAGPASPARVLDFGLPKNNGGGDPEKRPAGPLHLSGTGSNHQPSSSSTGLAPSPELKPRSSTRAARTADAPPADAQESVNPFDFDSLPSPSASPTSFTLVPRELPQQIDPRSVHYPGFIVFQDPHTVVYPPPASNGPTSDAMDVDGEVCKENIPPRRRMKKAATEPTGKADLFSPPNGTSAKKSYSLHDTPRMPTTRSNIGGMSAMRSPSLTPQNMIHKGMRQLMKDELDIGEGHPDSYE